MAEQESKTPPDKEPDKSGDKPNGDKVPDGYVPESDLMAVKGLLKTKEDELKQSHKTLDSKQAEITAAEEKVKEFDGITVKVKELETNLTNASETIKSMETANLQTRRDSLVKTHNLDTGKIKDYNASQLDALEANLPAADKKGIDGKGLDTSGTGQTDLSTLHGRAKVAYALEQESKS